MTNSLGNSNDISIAYRESLEKILTTPEKHIFGLLTIIEQPLLGNINEEVDTIKSEIKGAIQTYKLTGINLDKKIHEGFKEFLLYEKGGRKWYGKDKIADRIYEPLDKNGTYHKALVREIRRGKGLIDFIKEHLDHGKVKGKIHNSLLCTVFDSNRHTCYPNAPCLLSIDFKPEGKKLHMIASWRAQFFNTKAYGNFISLAMLLRDICMETTFQPGKLISMAHKAILEGGVDNTGLLQRLKMIGI